MKPINCDTAREDTRVLVSGKASIAEMANDGVIWLALADAVLGILTFTEKEKLEVASGLYNKKRYEKIVEIKRECGIEEGNYVYAKSPELP